MVTIMVRKRVLSIKALELQLPICAQGIPEAFVLTKFSTISKAFFRTPRNFKELQRRFFELAYCDLTKLVDVQHLIAEDHSPDDFSDFPWQLSKYRVFFIVLRSG